MFHRLIDRWRQSIVLHNNNDKDNDNDNIGGTTDLQFRPTGETLSIPLRNSMKVPRLTGTSTAASSCSEVKQLCQSRWEQILIQE